VYISHLDRLHSSSTAISQTWRTTWILQRSLQTLQHKPTPDRQPSLLSQPRSSFSLPLTSDQPPDPTQNIVFLSYREHGICYNADGRHCCDELRSSVHTLSRLDQPLGDVTSMALRDEEEVESDVLARCRQRIRDAVRAGCDWSDLTYIVYRWKNRSTEWWLPPGIPMREAST